MKKVLILGSTGSIGVQALQVIRNLKDNFRVVGLSAHRNIEKLMEQVQSFSPDIFFISDPQSHDTLSSQFNFSSVSRLYPKEKTLSDLVNTLDWDILISSVSGRCGLSVLFASLKKGKRVGLVNKEAIVMAGHLLHTEAKKYGTTLIPIDSEHSAIFQCLQGHSIHDVSKIILTASGGSFYHKNDKTQDLKHVDIADVLNHPTWTMGDKITVDSATLMNKGLEVIEACYLFDIPLEKIQIVIHPQSIMHSAVEFIDRSILAQLSSPDMSLSIQYALTYPERKLSTVQPIDWFQLKKLEFFKPDFKRFPALQLALDAMETGGSMPIVLSVANELSVHAFLNSKICFVSIVQIVQKILEKHVPIYHLDFERILEVEEWTIQYFKEVIHSIKE